MKWIQAAITFHPEQVCMSRPGLGGLWRVQRCEEVGTAYPTRVILQAVARSHEPGYTRPVLRMMVARPYRGGVMVKPIKLALEFLRENRAAANLDRT